MTARTKAMMAEKKAKAESAKSYYKLEGEPGTYTYQELCKKFFTPYLRSCPTDDRTEKDIFDEYVFYGYIRRTQKSNANAQRR